MTGIGKNLVQFLTIDSEYAGQRVDNFLFHTLKGVPKSHVYRLIRAGEVRINKKRIQAATRLETGDVLRIPPVRTALLKKPDNIPVPACTFPVLYEDDVLLAIDKPAGIAVHGGSGISYGVIEQIRQTRTDLRYLELVHRLDRETSGVLLIAKKRSALVKLHAYFRQHTPQKTYYALGCGIWNKKIRSVKQPLFKFHNAAGEKFVRVDHERGQYAHTVFEVESYFPDFSLLKVILKTGRTHQIRVHMQAEGCPIAGDGKYGLFALNKELTKKGLKRMFLHASSLSLPHPVSGESLTISSALPSELANFLDSLKYRTD